MREFIVRFKEKEYSECVRHISIPASKGEDYIINMLGLEDGMVEYYNIEEIKQ